MVEQPTNFTEGAVWPLESLCAVRDIASRHDLRTHLDGARLLNAVAATGISADRFTRGWDSAWLDLTRGPGCPVGAVLCGSRGFVNQAWQLKYRLGGAMRQSGVLAAAGLFALDHHIEQANTDNRHARLLHERLSGTSVIAFAPIMPETNIVRFQAVGVDAVALESVCLRASVRLRALDRRYLRAVCHLDVNEAQVLRAAEVIADTAVAFHGR